MSALQDKPPISIPLADEDSLWTPEDVARFLQVPVSWVYQRTRKPRPEDGAKKRVGKLAGPKYIPHIRVGRYPRFERHIILELKDQMRRDYTPQGRVN